MSDHRDRANLDAIRREQLAAYLIGIMRADWTRPDAEVMHHILRLAGEQITAISEITDSRCLGQFQTLPDCSK
jgi:hypothetical protein